MTNPLKPEEKFSFSVFGTIDFWGQMTRTVLKGRGGEGLSHDKCVVADSALDFVTACALHTMLVHT